MSCNCSQAKPVPTCIDALIIGVSNTQFNYKVYLRTATGRIDEYAGSFIYGTQLLQIESPVLRVGEEYEIWITKDDANSIEQREIFTVDSTNLTCVTVQFEYCNNEFTSQEIHLE